MKNIYFLLTFLGGLGNCSSVDHEVHDRDSLATPNDPTTSTASPPGERVAFLRRDTTPSSTTQAKSSSASAPASVSATTHQGVYFARRVLGFMCPDSCLPLCSTTNAVSERRMLSPNEQPEPQPESQPEPQPKDATTTLSDCTLSGQASARPKDKIDDAVDSFYKLAGARGEPKITIFLQRFASPSSAHDPTGLFSADFSKLAQALSPLQSVEESLGRAAVWADSGRGKDQLVKHLESAIKHATELLELVQTVSDPQDIAGEIRRFIDKLSQLRRSAKRSGSAVAERIHRRDNFISDRERAERIRRDNRISAHERVRDDIPNWVGLD